MPEVEVKVIRTASERGRYALRCPVTASMRMKLLLPLLLLTRILCSQPASEQHEFIIPNLTTESGTVLPHAVVVYGTYGHLNAARDNVVLLPSHYMANLHGYEWLVGPDRALDPSK